MGADRKFVTWRWTGGAPLGIVHLDVRVRWGDPARFGESEDITEAVGKQGPTFYIDHANPPIRVEHGDLSTLAAMAREAVNAYFNITWEPILAIVIDHNSDAMLSATDCLGETTLHVTVTSYERGVGKDGQWWYRRSGKGRGGVGKPSLVIPGEPAIYPDTPEVRRRLVGLRTDLVAVHGRTTLDLASISKGPSST